MTRHSEQEIRYGQVWRRKKTGAEVVIATLQDLSSSWNPSPFYDIGWRAIGSKRKGQCFEDAFRRTYEYVKEADGD